MSQQFHPYVFTQEKRKQVTHTKTLYKDLHNSLIHNSPKLEITKMHKQIAVYSYNRRILGNKRNKLTHLGFGTINLLNVPGAPSRSFDSKYQLFTLWAYICLPSRETNLGLAPTGILIIYCKVLMKEKPIES